MTAGAIGIFAFGIAIGQGRIVIGRDALFHKTENNQLPTNLDYSSVKQVYDSLRQNYDGKLDQTTLLDGLKTGMANSLGDPYTEYFNPKAAKDFSDQLDGTFVGIGAELTKDATTGAIEVVSPIDGFPAQKAGMKPKDLIAAIDSKTTTNMTISDAVKKIRGTKGTSVKLDIVRDGSTALTLNIVREEITVPSVTSKTLDGNIGYIKISRFGVDTVSLTTAAANKFKDASVKGIVLDLRGNPGGLLDAAVGVSSLWLQNKTVLTERRDSTIVRTYTTTGDSPLVGIQTIALIDSGSASASEITAGALHDNKAATLIGEKSFGKGVVQQLINFNDGSELKVTIASWYTPSGKSINKQGITPDKTVKISDDQAKAHQDPQLDAATAQLAK
jgi:carboxyl-terminal processing protease